MKRSVTQEELDALYAVLAPLRARDGQSESDEMAAMAPLPSGGPATPELVGVHIGAERTNVIYLTSKHVLVKHMAVNYGYESLDKLLEGLGTALADAKKSRLSVYVTLSGKPTHFMIARMPKLPRPQLLKAFRVQMKQATNEDWEDLHDLVVTPKNKASSDGQLDYFVGGLHKSMIEKIARPLKKMKLKVVSWDFDILCYARAANLLWQKAKVENTTRLMVLLDWDHCHLMILTPDGRLVAPRLPMGINSFLDRLMETRVPGSPDGDSSVLGADTVEVRERKVLANQAIHDVYVPLGQQIKTQLFSGCNEHGIPLPTHFCVVSVGAGLFNLVDSLSADLGLKPIAIERMIPVEAVAALGATLWEKAELRFNVMPAGMQEAVRNIKEMSRNLSSLLAKRGISGGSNRKKWLPDMSELAGKGPFVAAGVVGLTVAVGYPLAQRLRVSRDFESKKTEYRNLQSEKERIKQAKDREALTDKKMSLVKVIEGKRPAMSRALRELLSVLPNDIQLQTLAYKDPVLQLKGLSRSPASVQAFLKSALTLRLLTDPTPVGIKRDKELLEFEITFKFRPREG